MYGLNLLCFDFFLLRTSRDRGDFRNRLMTSGKVEILQILTKELSRASKLLRGPLDRFDRLPDAFEAAFFLQRFDLAAFQRACERPE